MIKIKYLFSIACLLFACAPSRFVKPLVKGEQQVSASLGGPLINFGGAKIPVPFTTVCYGYGVKEGLTAFGGIHTTSALFGNFQTDIGIVKSIYKNDSLRFGITTTPTVNIAVHQFKQDFKLWPQIDFNGYWNYNKKKQNFLYAGITNWFELDKTKAHGEKQSQFYFFAPQIGHTFVGKKWNFNTEIKIIAPNVSNGYIIVDYTKLYGNKGVTGIYFSASRKF